MSKKEFGVFVARFGLFQKVPSLFHENAAFRLQSLEKAQCCSLGKQHTLQRVSA